MGKPQSEQPQGPLPANVPSYYLTHWVNPRPLFLLSCWLESQERKDYLAGITKVGTDRWCVCGTGRENRSCTSFSVVMYCTVGAIRRADIINNKVTYRWGKIISFCLRRDIRYRKLEMERRRTRETHLIKSQRFPKAISEPEVKRYLTQHTYSYPSLFSFSHILGPLPALIKSTIRRLTPEKHSCEDGRYRIPAQHGTLYVTLFPFFPFFPFPFVIQ